jgi:hypothetical protein
MVVFATSLEQESSDVSFLLTLSHPVINKTDPASKSKVPIRFIFSP